MTRLSKLGCVLVLTLGVFVTTGCHELYCNFVEGLAGEPLSCEHDSTPDPGEVDFPDLPPPPPLPQRTATISWSEPVVAGEPTELAATAGFGANDRPLRYRWDLDGDGTVGDFEGVGDDGRRAPVTFEAAGNRTVRVQVTRASDSSPSRADTAVGTATLHVEPGQGSSPTAPNPLEVDIQLASVPAPPQERPVVEVRATVSQDGAAVSGAHVRFDFENDGATDEERTSTGEGRATAQHDYPNGEHTVTVAAGLGDSSGSASKTFTYTDGEISARVRAAARGRPFTARFGLTALTNGKRVKHGRVAGRSGELAIGGLVGHLKGKAPAALAGLLKSTWVTRSTFTYDRKRGRWKVTGVAVATFVSTPGRACVRYSVKARKGRRSGSARLTLLGGSGAASTTRAVAKARVTGRRRAFRLKGRLTRQTVAPRGLNRACERVLSAVAALPG